MKSPSLVMIVSLAANVALISLAVHRLGGPPAEASATERRPGPREDPAPRPSAPLWASLETDDMPALVARLRLAGLPEALIRSIVKDRVKARYSAARVEVTQRATGAAFWRLGGADLNAAAITELRIEHRRLVDEENALLEELLGAEAALPNPRLAAFLQAQMGELSPRKMEQIKQLLEDYEDFAAQVNRRAKGLLMPEDRRNLEFLDREKQKDMAALLTPEELATFELRQSSAAARLRRELGGLDVTDDQFKALFALVREFEAERSAMDRGATSASQGEADRELSERIKAALDAPLRKDYELWRDPLGQLARRFGLPKDTLSSVLNLKQETQQRVDLLRSDPSLSPAERERQSAALIQGAREKVRTELGLRVYQVYERGAAADWLKPGSPRAAASSPDTPASSASAPPRL